MVDKAVLNTVKKYLQMLCAQGVPVKAGVLFGSYVTGRTHEWSDIDLLVVSRRYDLPFTHRDAMFLWHVAADVDSRIEPLPCGEKQWEEDDASMIIEIGRREGEKVTI